MMDYGCLYKCVKYSFSVTLEECVCVGWGVEPFSFAVFLMGTAGLDSAPSASADTNPVGAKQSVDPNICMVGCVFTSVGVM